MKTTSKITIKTRLHEGIYKSDGGGETRAVAEWNLGPKNLLAANRELTEIMAANKRSYGSVGAGRSWLEIDGTAINDDELQDDMTMADAKELISDVQTGKIHKTREAIEKSHEEWREQELNKLAQLYQDEQNL